MRGQHILLVFVIAALCAGVASLKYECERIGLPFCVIFKSTQTPPSTAFKTGKGPPTELSGTFRR